MRTFLIGFMGCGKSLIGKVWAEKINCTFIDIDALIEEKAGKSISEIFEEEGEASFRKTEREVLRSMKEYQDVVIATGGGAPCSEVNQSIIRSLGPSVYLRLSPNTLFERLKKNKSHRPLIKDLDDEELLEYIKTKLGQRESYYLKADHIINVEVAAKKFK